MNKLTFSSHSSGIARAIQEIDGSERSALAARCSKVADGQNRLGHRGVVPIGHMNKLTFSSHSSGIARAIQEIDGSERSALAAQLFQK